MYQHIIDRTRTLRGDRHGDMARDMVTILQSHCLPAETIMAGALYHLAQVTPKQGLEALPDVTPAAIETASAMRCMGIIANNKSRDAWSANLCRFWFHVDENILGRADREAIQCAASISRIMRYESKGRWGQGLSFLAAELLYTLKMADTPLRAAVHSAIGQAADRIGYGRNDVEARAYQIRGFVFGLYPVIYHGSKNPSRSVNMPTNWAFYVGNKETYLAGEKQSLTADSAARSRLASSSVRANTTCHAG